MLRAFFNASALIQLSFLFACQSDDDSVGFVVSSGFSFHLNKKSRGLNISSYKIIRLLVRGKK